MLCRFIMMERIEVAPGPKELRNRHANESESTTIGVKALGHFLNAMRRTNRMGRTPRHIEYKAIESEQSRYQER